MDCRLVEVEAGRNRMVLGKAWQTREGGGWAGRHGLQTLEGGGWVTWTSSARQGVTDSGRWRQSDESGH